MTNNIIYGYVKGKINLLDNDDAHSKALLAKLRRGIGKHPGTLPDVWEITLADLPETARSRDNEPSYEEWAVYTALTLYASHRQGKSNSMSEEDCKFGTAVARLVTPDRNNLDAVKKRFDAMITAVDFTELAYHARGLIGQMKAKDIKFNYPDFAKALHSYQYEGKKNQVRLHWGEDFYSELNNSNKEKGKNENE